MRRARLATVLAAGLLPGTVGAITWDVEPRISALVSYVDNVTLSSTDEQSDVVYQLVPGVRIKGEGQRFTADLDYGVYAVKFQDNPEADDVFQQGNGRLQWATRNDVFSVNATASKGQQAATLDGALPSNLESISANRTTISSYTVSPRFQYRFGGTAQLAVQGDYTRVEYDEGSVLDDRADVRGYSVTLGSGTNFHRMDWALNHLFREFNVDEPDRDDHSRQSNLTLGYRLSSTVRWFGTGGNEEIVSQGVEIFQDDGYWETGLEWNPSSRTTLRASAGERAFGETQSFSFSRRTPMVTVAAGYSESITSQAYEQAFDLSTPATGTGDITDIGANNELFLSKRADLGLTLGGRRNTVTISLFDEQREFLTSLTEDDFTGGNLLWTHEFGRRASLATGFEYAERTASDTQAEDEFSRITAALRREIAQGVEVSAVFDHNRQRSNIGIDYKQNIIRLGITARY